MIEDAFADDLGYSLVRTEKYCFPFYDNFTHKIYYIAKKDRDLLDNMNRNEERREQTEMSHRAEKSLDEMYEEYSYEPTSSLETPDQYVDRKEKSERLNAKLVTLTEDEKAVLDCLKDDMSQREIAEALGKTRAWARERISSIQEKLEEFKNEDF